MSAAEAIPSGDPNKYRSPNKSVSRRKPSVIRISRAALELHEHNLTIEELRRLVTQVSRSRLVPVVGEEQLLQRLQEIAAEATATVGFLAEASTADQAEALDRLEELLKQPLWDIAETSLRSLGESNQTLQVHILELTEDLNYYRTQFDELRKAVSRAKAVRAKIDENDVKLAGEVYGLLRQTEQDVANGRWDTTAIAVEQARSSLAAHQLSDPVELAQRIEKVNELADFKEALELKMLRRAELVLISGASSNGDVPYKVMLKRPGFKFSQETNLHDDSSILEADQDLFRETIDAIAADSVEGIRAATSNETRRARPEPSGTSKHLENLDPGSRLEKVGRRMYSLLIPDAMQRLIDETQDVPLTITSNNPELPWELLHDGEGYLCLERMFARMPAGQTFPRRSRGYGQPSATNTRVLLIDSAPEGDLPQAKQEIDEIETVLADMQNTTVTRVHGPEVTSSKLTDELSAGTYDVIHYAGHAGFDPDRPDQSYLLLAGKERFRAARVQRLLEGHPVVFLNACESSRSSPPPVGVSTGGIVAHTQGLASAFVYGGAQACVGALWPVFDDTARAFAAEFYRQLLEGRERVGEALRLARKKLHALQTDRVTWAAYALYGDPSYRLGDTTRLEFTH